MYEQVIPRCSVLVGHWYVQHVDPGGSRHHAFLCYTCLILKCTNLKDAVVFAFECSFGWTRFLQVQGGAGVDRHGKNGGEVEKESERKEANSTDKYVEPSDYGRQGTINVVIRMVVILKDVSFSHWKIAC